MLMGESLAIGIWRENVRIHEQCYMIDGVRKTPRLALKLARVMSAATSGIVIL